LKTDYDTLSKLKAAIQEMIIINSYLNGGWFYLQGRFMA